MNDVMGRLAQRVLLSALITPLLATLLGACTFGPDGHIAAPQPAHYGVEPLLAQTDAAQGVAQHFALGARPVPQWWRAYGSAALDALVEEALRNNYDLTATTHTKDGTTTFAEAKGLPLLD